MLTVLMNRFIRLGKPGIASEAKPQLLAVISDLIRLGRLTHIVRNTNTLLPKMYSGSK